MKLDHRPTMASSGHASRPSGRSVEVRRGATSRVPRDASCSPPRAVVTASSVALRLTPSDDSTVSYLPPATFDSRACSVTSDAP